MAEAKTEVCARYRHHSITKLHTSTYTKIAIRNNIESNRILCSVCGCNILECYVNLYNIITVKKKTKEKKENIMKYRKYF